MYLSAEQKPKLLELALEYEHGHENLPGGVSCTKLLGDLALFLVAANACLLLHCFEPTFMPLAPSSMAFRNLYWLIDVEVFCDSVLLWREHTLCSLILVLSRKIL